MKKYFILAAAALLTACSSDEVTSVSQLTDNGATKAISVGAYLPGMTKSLATVESLNEGFILKAVSGEEELFNTEWAYNADDQMFTATDGEQYFWPENPNAKVTFSALYDPQHLNEGISEDGCTLALNYTDDEDEVDYCNDYLVATAEQSMAEGTNVELTFNHLLAQVKMSVAGVNPHYTYEVYNITVNTPSTGVYNFDLNEAAYSQYSDVNFYNATLSEGQRQGKVTVNGSTTTNILRGEDDQTNQSPMLIAPGETTITITYAYKMTGVADAELSDEITKTAKFDAVKGALNLVAIKLPMDRTPITVTSTITDWTNGNAIPVTPIEPEP